jgi:hypothetical protein
LFIEEVIEARPAACLRLLAIVCLTCLATCVSAHAQLSTSPFVEFTNDALA